jgi:hypothetical protein
MWRYALVIFALDAALLTACLAKQTRGRVSEAGIDTDGNIYVVSDAGEQINMATASHCIAAHVADDLQTVGCSIARSAKPEEAMQSLRLEIYLRNGKKQIIETETPMDWHFWRGGQQVTVYCHALNGEGRYALYDAASAHLVEKFEEPANERPLPEWAKGPAQIEDESVPVGDEYNQERTKWIAKVLRQIQKIKPGMKRQDLLKVFTTEGGLSSRLQRTYVSSECPFIKVDVRFRATSESREMDEDLDDIIVSISQPYLAWSVMD